MSRIDAQSFIGFYGLYTKGPGWRAFVLPVLCCAGLSVQVLNPPCRRVADFAEVTLCGREIGVPENYLADDLNRNAGPGRICCGMPPEIMWPEFDAGHLARLPHDQPGRGVGDWEYSAAGLYSLILDISMESVGDFPKDEHDFGFFPTLWST